MATAKKNRQQLTHLYTKNERLTCTTKPVTCEFRPFGRGSGPAVASGRVAGSSPAFGRCQGKENFLRVLCMILPGLLWADAGGGCCGKDTLPGRKEILPPVQSWIWLHLIPIF